MKSWLEPVAARAVAAVVCACLWAPLAGRAQPAAAASQVPAGAAVPAGASAPAPGNSAYAEPGADPLRNGRRLRIGVQRFAAPFAFEKTSGDFRGYSVDLCLRLVELMRNDRGWTFERERDVQFVPVAPKTRMMMLLSGEIDMECGSTSNTPERRKLGIAFSPTIFVSEVAALMAPKVAPHSRSLDPFVQVMRQARLPIVTTEGSTSVGHVRALAELTGSDLVATFGANHRDSLQRLRNREAGAFVMDRALLATMLQTNPRLVKQGYALSTWSPAPGKLECYGVMTRALNLALFGRPLRAKLETMRASRELHALYVKWFQKPLPPEDAVPDLPPGQALGLGMLPQHEMLLLDPRTQPCAEETL